MGFGCGIVDGPRLPGDHRHGACAAYPPNAEELHDLTRMIMHELKQLHCERASFQARASGEIANNAPLIFAELRTDLWGAVRKACGARWALRNMHERRAATKQRIFCKQCLLAKVRAVDEFACLHNHARGHSGPSCMWEQLAAECATGTASNDKSTQGLAKYRGWNDGTLARKQRKPK